MEKNNQPIIHSISPTNPENNISFSSQTNQEKILASLEEKLAKFVKVVLAKNPEKWSTDDLEIENEKWVRLNQILDLVNYEGGRVSSSRIIKSKRKNFLTDEELELAEKELFRLGEELGVRITFSHDDSSDSESESEEEENQLAVITSQGKEIIKNEISQELIKAKEIFESAEIGSVSTDHLKEELTEKLLELHERRGNEAEINLMSYVNPFSNRTSNQKWRKEKAEKVAEVLGKTTMKLVNEAITDLEKRKKKAVKRVNELIGKRNEEVVEAKKVIEALEIVNKERSEEIEDLREKADREIKSLQTEIGTLLSRLKEYEKKKNELRNETEKLFKNPKILSKPATMKSDEEKIKELEEFIEQLQAGLKISNAGWDSEKKKVEDCEGQLEREKKKSEANLEAKENELARKMKIANDLQQKLNGEIREWKAKHGKLKEELDEIDEEKDELVTKNKELTQDNENYRVEAAEWKKKSEELETKLEATKPSMLYRTLDKIGLVSLKNTLVNASAIVGIVVVLYAISWMWKHLIKPTYYNFKGEPKPPTQASPFTQEKTFTHSPSHSPQIIKEVVREERPVRVIEPAKADQAVHPQSDSPTSSPKLKEETDEVETNETEDTENLDKPRKTKRTKRKREKKKVQI